MQYLRRGEIVELLRFCFALWSFCYPLVLPKKWGKEREIGVEEVRKREKQGHNQHYCNEHIDPIHWTSQSVERGQVYPQVRLNRQ